MFMGMMGFPDLGINAEAQVGLGQSNIEVHMVLDNSGSMNIVDGETEILKYRDMFLPASFQYSERISCAFACHLSAHIDGTDVTYNGKTGAEIAAENGVMLREDSVKKYMSEQAGNLLSGSTKNRVEIAVYSFEERATEIIGVSRNLSKIQAAIGSIKNMSGHTDLSTTVPDLIKMVGPSGNGTAANPKKKIVLITDGVQRHPSDSPYLLDPKTCDRLKADGRELYVINMAYPDPDLITNVRFSTIKEMEVIQPKLEAALVACASKGKYFRADYGASIKDAFEQMSDELQKSDKIYLSL